MKVFNVLSGSFEDKLFQVQARLPELLKRFLPPPNTTLHEAMHYACLNGGKRLRPLLVYATAEAYALPWEALDTLAVAVELIHCYSLVHDDLPAMDDDDLRRGKATCHKAFDEATAILVGDALQTLAFEILSDTTKSCISSDYLLAIIRTLAQAIGPQGMVLGQALDMAATARTISAQELITLHHAKTGALINACVQCSAIACGETDLNKLALLQNYGRSIGLAFQIQDDLLDVTGESYVLGKQTGMDKENQKNTFVSIFGLEHAKRHAKTLFIEATQYLEAFNKPSQTLHDIAYYCVARVM